MASYLAGWLIDGTGAPARRDMLIRVESRALLSLQEIKRSELNAPGLDYVDYSDCTILPALVDCHVHLTLSGTVDPEAREKQLTYTLEQNGPLIAERIRKSLACGLMALRDGGDAGGQTLEYAKRRAGDVPCARLKCAGTGWRASGRYGKLVAIAPESGSTLAESIEKHSLQADHVKILNSGLNSLTQFGRQTPPQFSLEELAAAVRVAKKRGQKIVVHANGQLPVELAIEAGCDSIEHGFFMGGDNMKKMAERQLFWAPTAYTMKALGMQQPADSIESEIAARNVEHQLTQMARARELGVPVVAGTDAGSLGVHHGSDFVEELKLMMQAGFSAEEAIRSATLEGARLLGIERELGCLEKGMPASFIVVEGPPAAIPESMRKPRAVYSGGERVV